MPNHITTDNCKKSPLEIKFSRGVKGEIYVNKRRKRYDSLRNG